MPTLIDRDARREDRWTSYEGDPSAVPAGAAVLVPLAAWKTDAAALRTRGAQLGLLLGPADEPREIAGELDAFGLIAVEFPKFTDGRGYSIARALRERLGWRGELRAVGDVLRDQLFYMSRCGFDSFALADGEDADGALAAFSTFTDAYQGATDLVPLFRRRGAAADAAQARSAAAALIYRAAHDERTEGEPA